MKGDLDMDITLSLKKIKDLCGTISFKKGQTFYNTGKVQFNECAQTYWDATVKSTEKFQVRIETKPNVGLQVNCTCPALEGFNKNCQHIAAVLLAIYDHQKQQQISNEARQQEQFMPELSNRFFSIFDNTHIRSTGHQRHFEERTLLTPHFCLMPLQFNEEANLFGLRLTIEGVPVRSIRTFLNAFKYGHHYLLSDDLLYDAKQYCFMTEPDVLLQQLANVVKDEAFYIDTHLQRKKLK